MNRLCVLIVIVMSIAASVFESPISAWADPSCTGTLVNGYCLAPGADLANANLAGADLSNLDLSASNLDGANLSGATITNTDFDNAQLIGADLSGAETAQPGCQTVVIPGPCIETNPKVLKQCNAIALTCSLEPEFRYANLTGADFSRDSLVSPNVNLSATCAELVNRFCLQWNINYGVVAPADLAGALAINLVGLPTSLALPYVLQGNDIVIGTVPGAPISVSVLRVAPGRTATVSWSPPATDGGAAINAYVARFSPGSLSCSLSGSGPGQCSVNGLAPNKNYVVSVTAVNGIGTGAPSSPTPASLSFPSPTLTRLVATQNQLTLSWSVPRITNGAVDSYVGTVSDSDGHTFSCTTAPNVKSCAISGLVDLTRYTATVTASELGTGTVFAPGNSMSAVPYQRLTPPPILATVVTKAHTVSLNWGPAGGGDGQAITYEVLVRDSSSGLLVDSFTSGFSCQLSGLTAGAKYSFTIAARTPAGVSGLIPSVITKARTFTAK